MTTKFINTFFILIIILIFISNISIAYKNYTPQNPNIELADFTFHYSKNSIFSWPIFGYYNISSFFGYRKSPTIRCFYISFRN